jgi:ABC-type bacteriocin/lantibiotic exporter with double-glycine peptidase domain
VRRSGQVPVVLQTAATDCGAACLAMVLRRSGLDVGLGAVRDALGTSRDGVTAAALVAAASHFGLRARAFASEPARLAHAAPLILHWEFNHFVVLQRWTPDHAIIVDPAVGRRRVTAEEFDAAFTGVAMAFEPRTTTPPPRRSPPSRWRAEFLHAAVGGQRRLWGQALAASLLLQLTGLALPVATVVVVDHADQLAAPSPLPVIGGFLLVVAVTQLVLSYLRSCLVVVLRSRLDEAITGRIVTHLCALPYSYFGVRGSADLATRTSSVVALRDLFSRVLAPALLDAPLVVGYAVVVLCQNLLMGSYLVACACLQVGVLVATHRRVSTRTQEDLSTQAVTHGYLIEAIKGIESVKSGGFERYVLANWARRFVVNLNASVSAGQLTAAVDAVLGCLRFLIPAGLTWIGAWQVRTGSLSLGTMLGLIAISSLVVAPLATVGQGVQLSQVASAHVQRLADIMECSPEPSGEPAAQPLQGRIDLEHVGFRHHGRPDWVLRDVSLSIPPGAKVALVGPAGSGKSTLVRLILGLYTPTEGAIRIDGAPVGPGELASLRSQIGVVTQDPTFFTGTIRENIALGAPAAELDEVVAAAGQACIHEEIDALPMRYETALVDGGGLSGGQLQRVALARALLCRPRVLLLDEATSHLDALTEQRVNRRLGELEVTRVVVAHRLSTVLDADVVFVFDGGRLVERGTHASLMDQGGLYARLASCQLGLADADAGSVRA